MRQAMRMAGAVVLGLGLSLAAGDAAAQRVEGTRAAAHGVYQAEVTVRSQSEAERKAGFARALAQVLGKLSGDRNTASQPGVAGELAKAADYVESFDYRQDQGVSPITGAPSFDTTLIARFDQGKVDGLVAALGLPVWPEPRPKPVLWLAIDDGSGPRLVGLAQSAVARSLLDRARDRGYRLGLPTGNAAEQAAVGAIWRGDAGAIARISSRYRPPMQLIGKLYRQGAGWRADWIFVDHGKVLSRWNSEDANARQAMAAGADGAADALVKRYAKRTAVGPAGTYLVRFEGIDDARDYLRLMAALKQLPVISAIAPVRAAPGVLDLNLDLVSGLAGLRQMLDQEIFEAVGGAGIDDTLIDGTAINGTAIDEATAPPLPGLPAMPDAGGMPPTFRLR